MKSTRRLCVIAVALFTLVAIPMPITAQQHLATDLLGLPMDAQRSVSSALGRDLPEYRAKARNEGFEIQNTAHKLAADFTSEGVALRSGDLLWRMALCGYGYGIALNLPATVVPAANLNRIEYHRGAITEWYVNGPAGLEQGFTVAEPPGKTNVRPLTITLSLSRELTAIVDQGRTGLRLESPGGKAGLRYTGLSAVDARGKKLPAWLEVRGERLLLRVRDVGAHYPVVIDPWVQLAKLTASDGAAFDTFGASVSISGDTVVVGSPDSNDLMGAAYVFEKPAGGWGNRTQTAKLTASDGADAKFGSSVSISGNTIVVGAPSQPVLYRSYSENLQGAAYVFVKPASGWVDMTPTAKLTASDGQSGDTMGLSVGVSGKVIVVGAVQIDSGGPGAAYVFVKPSGGWQDMTETAELTASDGAWGSLFGFSVAIKRDTVLVGASNAWVNGRYQGAAYVFEKPESGWAIMTQTAELTASNPSVASNFGFSVSISDNTAVVGNPDETVDGVENQGAAYVFVKPPSGWKDTTENAELSATSGNPGSSRAATERRSRTSTPDNFGSSVVISGNTLVAGAPGHNDQTGTAYVFRRPASGWTTSSKFDAELTAKASKKGDSCGEAVSISGDTILVGAYLATVGSNVQQGTAYLFGK